MSPDPNTATSDDSVALTFLSDFDARTVEAIAERIIPDTGDGAGATAAGVVYYIDRAISGVSANLQHVYRVGLKALDVCCQDLHSRHFVDLDGDQQDSIVREFIGPEATRAEAAPQMFGDELDAERPIGRQAKTDADDAVLDRFFAVIREHTIEGFFCDPVYGGNRGTVGWKLVGFPGAYWGYTAQQMASGFDGRSLPIMTLSDLRTQLKGLPENSTFNRNEEV